jgi:hypothetical protein
VPRESTLYEKGTYALDHLADGFFELYLYIEDGFYYVGEGIKEVYRVDEVSETASANVSFIFDKFYCYINTFAGFSCEE